MNSIRTSLVAMLIAAFVLVSFLAALKGYRSSMAEAEKLLDSQLQYLSDVLLMSVPALVKADTEPPTDSAAPAPGLTQVAAAPGGGFAFQVWRDGVLLLASPGAPADSLNALVEGYRFANFSGYRWRTLTVRRADGSWHIVAERADLRHILAEKVVLESVLPLLLWLPAAAGLIWVLVGWGLRPLRELSTQINSKRGDNLEPLGLADSPAELVPVVSATNSLLARLSAAIEREKHFASHAAHELRTPLSVLKVHLHNLSGELPAGHSALRHANAGVERMHNLVEQILDLNRTNPEIIKAKFQPVDLHSLAQRVTAAAWPMFSARSQILSLTGGPVLMHGDEAMLETLLQNLLSNANKYTPEGGEVRVFAGRAHDGAQLRVEDSGPGIPAQHRELVFQRFYRVNPADYGGRESGLDAAGGAPGSGLGLAIVQHIVHLHNARISLGENHWGTGLAVTVDFSLQESDA
jgi:two-component system sensor histidine kinase QseC